MATRVRGVILDVDGTLVNSNDAHAHAWVKAMEEQGDKVLPEVLNISKDSDKGKAISQRRKQIFKQRYLPHVKAFPQALELLQRMHQQGLRLVIATSAEPDELNSLLQIIGPHASELFEHEASSKDAKQSKPDPDVMQVALKRIQFDPVEVLMFGDTGYDIEAASKVEVRTIAFRSGGWSDNDLQGAIEIYDGPADMLAHYDQSALVKGIA